MTWYCVRTATRQEHRAIASMREAGVTCYLPCETRWRKHARVRDKVQSPLFPGYCFANIEPEDVYFVLAIDGVHSILGLSRKTQTVDPAIISDLSDAEAAGAFDQTLNDPKTKTFKPKDEVRVTSGQYTGFVGQVLQNRGKNRVLLLVSLFGRPQKIERPASELEAA